MDEERIIDSDMTVCSVVVPLYNEEEVIGETYKRLTAVMEGEGIAYELVMVNDGSRDNTEQLARAICAVDKRVKLINFSRNFGHQTAITAGMDAAGGQCVVVIDADLQDPPEVIPEMLAKWRSGIDVVYGKRISREGETFFKKFTAKMFYRTLNKMTDVDIPVDTGDFRLIDRKVKDALLQVREHNRYVRGIVSWLGFKTEPVEFERQKRFAGTTKYPLKKMLKLAKDALLSFSFKPLKLATFTGVFLSCASFIYLIVALILGICGKLGTVGIIFTALCVALFFQGLTLIAMGVQNEYMARMYEEALGRPLYLIRDRVNFSDQE
ncbi:MAG: glycosyltransferase family 2 protein [Clostridia bacterium]|nr:glycosyltransferase family 2 protein [Clostridia bacterium]